MKHVKLSNIKLNQIQIFLTVVECGSFSGAADAMSLSQPMVSKTIQNMENELGIILFTRFHGKPLLTPAGRECYQEWSTIIKQFEASLEKAHATQEGKSSHLKIGISSLATEELELFSNIQKLKEKKDVDIHIEYQPMGALISALLLDEYDAVGVSKHLLKDVEGKGLKWKTICESTLAIFVPTSNPLSKKKSLSFKDLKKESFISLSEKFDPQYVQLLNYLGKEAGFTPQISHYIPNELSFKINLQLGNGIALIDSRVGIKDKDIKMFPLEDMRNDFILCWKESNPNKVLSQFIKML